MIPTNGDRVSNELFLLDGGTSMIEGYGGHKVYTAETPDNTFITYSVGAPSFCFEADTVIAAQEIARQGLEFYYSQVR